MVREKNDDLVIVTNTFFTFFQCEKNMNRFILTLFWNAKRDD